MWGWKWQLVSRRCLGKKVLFARLSRPGDPRHFLRPREVLQGTDAEHIPHVDIFSSASRFGHPDSTSPDLSEMISKGTKYGPRHVASCWHPTNLQGEQCGDVINARKTFQAIMTILKDTQAVEAGCNFRVLHNRTRPPNHVMKLCGHAVPSQGLPFHNSVTIYL